MAHAQPLISQLFLAVLGLRRSPSRPPPRRAPSTPAPSSSRSPSDEYGNEVDQKAGSSRSATGASTS